MVDFEGLLGVLNAAGVEYVVIGGVAATVHGTARLTQDLDIVYARQAENFDRLVAALAPHQPYLRGAPPNLPFRWDRQTLAMGLNFTLTTQLGPIDLLAEVPGGGTYDLLRPHSVEVEVFGQSFLCVDLATLIRLKKAAGRPKDLEAIAELETIRSELG